MKFSEDFIEKIREANDLVEIVGRHTVFKNGGRSLMGLCPFPDHAEKSPSFSVSQEKQLYHCFGCGKSGNIYSFLRDYYGYSFVESIEYLAKKAGIPLPVDAEKSHENEKYKNEKNEQKKILGIALEFFRMNLQNLGEEHSVVKYLKNRNFHEPEMIKTLNLGWAKDEWEALTNHLIQKKVSLNLSEDLGLIRKKKESSGYYDIFRGRVIFPVFSFSGEVLGFGGRVLGDEKPKYLNSPESNLFKKGKILYGQNWASSEIRRFDEALIVEGYTDWAALYVSGIKNVLGTMGTALTDNHANRIKRWCSKVVCLFDGDEAGLRASERALTNLFSKGVLSRGVFLPKGEDPDSFLKNYGVEKLKGLIKNSEDLFIKLLDNKLKNYSGKVYEKVEALSWCVEMLTHLDPRSPLYAVYIPEINARLGMGVPTIKAELKRAYGGKTYQKPKKKSVQSEETEDFFEKVTVKYRKNNPELIVFSLAVEDLKIREALMEEDFEFEDKGAQLLWRRVRSKSGQQGSKSGSLGAHLANFVSDPSVLTLTLEKPYSQLNEEQKFKLYEDCLQSIRKKQLGVQAKLISKKLGQNAADEELKQFMEIQRRKRNMEQKPKG